jgi:hypothetical protein
MPMAVEYDPYADRDGGTELVRRAICMARQQWIRRMSFAGGWRRQRVAVDMVLAES